MKKIIYSIVSLITFGSFSQENLVPNPSFEQVDGKIKEGGKIELAYPWVSATIKPVDLYSANAKADEFSVPENAYGEEKAQDGSNYVGINFYGYRGRSPKSYLQTELNGELVAGKTYCVKFFVSFSDRSKYASNNIGAHLSTEAINSSDEGDLNFKPQIMKLRNTPVIKQFDWTPICGNYTAKGGEKYITIGNFFSEENTTTERVKQSREFTGAQKMDGYYFLDNVSVFDMEGQPASACVCEKIAGGSLETEFKSFSTSEKDKASNKGDIIILNSDGTKGINQGNESRLDENSSFSLLDQEINFEANSKEATAEQVATLDLIVDYLKKNPNQKIKAIGQANKSETSAENLAKGRAFGIKKYCDTKGLTERVVLDFKLHDDNNPNNRKVTFEFVD